MSEYPIPPDLLQALNQFDSVVASETGWRVAALRSMIAEEYNHDQAHKPYSSLVMAHERISRLTAENRQLREALEAALPQMAHVAACISVNPTIEWGRMGSMSADKCACAISKARAALAQKEKP